MLNERKQDQESHLASRLLQNDDNFPSVNEERTIFQNTKN
jgi:hypothetical protein